MKKLTCLILVVLLSGCYVVKPGQETAAGLTQQKTYRWTEIGAIEVSAIGTHEEAFIMGEGKIVLNEDGSINTNESHLTHYLKSEPSADEAMATIGSILLANLEQTKQVNKTLDLILGVLPGVMSGTPGGNSDDPG